MQTCLTSSTAGTNLNLMAAQSPEPTCPVFVKSGPHWRGLAANSRTILADKAQDLLFKRNTNSDLVILWVWNQDQFASLNRYFYSPFAQMNATTLNSQWIFKKWPKKRKYISIVQPLSDQTIFFCNNV